MAAENTGKSKTAAEDESLKSESARQSMTSEVQQEGETQEAAGTDTLKTATEDASSSDEQSEGGTEEKAEKAQPAEGQTDEAPQTSDEESEAAGETTQEDNGASGTDKKSSRFFSKNRKDQQLADQNEQLKRKNDDLNDQLKRQMAEFDNFRKRTEKEKNSMFEAGERSVLEKFLPIIDNFERGLAAIPDSEKEDSASVGMEKIYKQLVKALEELEVTPIEAVGQEFSPDLHNAVMQAEEEGVGENIIVEEFQKGYLYRGNVLRHSMVKVNK